MAKQEKNQGLIDLAKNLNNVPWCEDYEKMISGMLYCRDFHHEVAALISVQILMHDTGTCCWSPQSKDAGNQVQYLLSS